MTNEPVGMYLPTTQTMRDAYAIYLTDGGADAPAAAAEFDRWLAAHDAEVQAEALRDAAASMAQLDMLEYDRPYEFAGWLRSRADDLEQP